MERKDVQAACGQADSQVLAVRSESGAACLCCGLQDAQHLQPKWGTSRSYNDSAWSPGCATPAATAAKVDHVCMREKWLLCISCVREIYDGARSTVMLRIFLGQGSWAVTPVVLQRSTPRRAWSR